VAQAGALNGHRLAGTSWIRTLIQDGPVSGDEPGGRAFVPGAFGRGDARSGVGTGSPPGSLGEGGGGTVGPRLEPGDVPPAECPAVELRREAAVLAVPMSRDGSSKIARQSLEIYQLRTRVKCAGAREAKARKASERKDEELRALRGEV
jgi:hypothetical protein